MMAQDSTDPTGVVSDNPRDKEVIRARDRKANAAIQLRLEGCDWDEIAEAIGYPTGRAALVATERALEKELRTESKDAMRKMADRRLTRLLQSVWKKAIDEESPEQMVAITKARELIADHRRLFGLDAPAEISLHSPSEGEIAAWVAEVAKVKMPELEEGDIFEDGEVLSDETTFEPAEA